MQDLLGEDSLITADAGYHSEQNLKQLAERKIDALIADNGMRQRDPRFAEQEKYKHQPDPLHDKSARVDKPKLYSPEDFTYDPSAQSCYCPAGKRLYRNGSGCVFNGYAAVKFHRIRSKRSASGVSGSASEAMCFSAAQCRHVTASSLHSQGESSAKTNLSRPLRTFLGSASKC